MTTLEGLAEALDCDLVYALAPRRSLARTLESQARRKAEHLLGRVDDSMRLEAQSVDADEMSKQVEELAEDLLRERGRDFWDL